MRTSLIRMPEVYYRHIGDETIIVREVIRRSQQAAPGSSPLQAVAHTVLQLVALVQLLHVRRKLVLGPLVVPVAGVVPAVGTSDQEFHLPTQFPAQTPTSSSSPPAALPPPSPPPPPPHHHHHHQHENSRISKSL